MGFFNLAFPCEEKKEKRKKHTFSFHAQAGFEPTTIQKMAKPDVKAASALVPTFGVCHSFSSLGGNRGKYIFKIQLIYIAKIFLIQEGLCSD